jgi:predicted nucleic acid-binding protein
MKYVLDSGVAVKVVVPETDSDIAIRLRNDFRAGLHQLIAPDVFPGEVGHALTKAERQLRITVGESVLLWQKVMAAPPLILPSLSVLLRAVEISSQTRIGVFDCLYIVLAEQENCEFVTADARLLKNTQSLFPFVKPLSSMP